MTKRPSMFAVLGMGRPETITDTARAREVDGWDGVFCVDSQSLAGDAYAQLTLVALATDRVAIGTWVTNPATRHPAVTANAIATIDSLSDGRAVLGVGRGDSALAHLGAAPVSMKDFSRNVQMIRDYLSGSEVPLDRAREWMPGARPITDLALGHAPAGSRLVWPHGSSPTRTVPIDVVASGPKMITLGAVEGDRLTLAVGADPERLAWAIGLVRSARRDAGLDPMGISLGAAFSVAPLSNLALARGLTAGGVASQARFSAMFGKPEGLLRPEDGAVLSGIGSTYDMNVHGGAGQQVEALTDDFVDRFSVVGPSSVCVDRIHEIADLGIDHMMIYMGSGVPQTPDHDRAYRTMIEEVLPGL